MSVIDPQQAGHVNPTPVNSPETVKPDRSPVAVVPPEANEKSKTDPDGEQQSPPKEQAAQTTQTSGEEETEELQRELRFSLNEQVDAVLIEIIDRQTNEVIRSIPASEFRRLEEITGTHKGLLVNFKV